MNPEEEEERKKNIICKLFRSEDMEEVRTSFEINYERLSYHHTNIALTKYIDWIHSLAGNIDPLVLLSFFRKLLVIASDNAAKKEKSASRKTAIFLLSMRKRVTELPSFHRLLRQAAAKPRLVWTTTQKKLYRIYVLYAWINITKKIPLCGLPTRIVVTRSIEIAWQVIS